MKQTLHLMLLSLILSSVMSPIQIIITITKRLMKKKEPHFGNLGFWRQTNKTSSLEKEKSEDTGEEVFVLLEDHSGETSEVVLCL